MACHGFGCATAPDSCQGFGPPGNWRRRSATVLPAPLLTSLQSVGAAKPRRRLAIELTGCVRSLALATPHKLAAVSDARAEGFSVDLYCALQSCIVNATADVYETERQAVWNFSAGVRAAGGEVINCSYSTFSEGDLSGHGRLTPSLRALHPDYPYERWKRVDMGNLDRTMAQANKWRQVALMRAQAGRTYDLIWRQRPDYVSTGTRLRELAGQLTARGASAAYAVPGICNGPQVHVHGPYGVASGIHGDIEAVLTPKAADYYDNLFSHVPTLYKGGSSTRGSALATPSGDTLVSRWPGPEVLLDQHMRRGGFRYIYSREVRLYRCSPYCFGAAAPCRMLPVAAEDPKNPEPCSSDKPVPVCFISGGCGAVPTKVRSIGRRLQSDAADGEMSSPMRRRARPAVTYLVLSLNTSARAAFIEANRATLPQLEVFRAVDGFDKQATIRALGTSRLLYHEYTYCSFTRFGTYGSLANYLTKYFALAYQVAHRLPYMAMLEDDMKIDAGFAPFVDAAVRTYLIAANRCDATIPHLPPKASQPPRCRERPEILQIGEWGEGYVSSLSSAQSVLRALQQQGVPQNIDIMLNAGHAGRVQHVRGAPWRHRVGPNLGDCLKTAHIRLGELPTSLVARPLCPNGKSICLQVAQRQRQRYCHAPTVAAAPGAVAPRAVAPRAVAPRAAARATVFPLAALTPMTSRRLASAPARAAHRLSTRTARQRGGSSAAAAHGRCPLPPGRVAIVLRGQAFRGAAVITSSGPSGLGGCSPYAEISEQLEATTSLRTQIIEPLERCAHPVDVYVTECSTGRGCPLLPRLLSTLREGAAGVERVVAVRSQCSSSGQAHNVRFALEAFKAATAHRVPPGVSPSAAVASYSLIVLTRHDLVWTSPIVHWQHANFSRIGFLSGCEPWRCTHCGGPADAPGSRYGGPPSRCVQDSLHLIPGSLFDAFDAAVGKRGTHCFDGSNKESGHACGGAVEASAGVRGVTGLILPLEVWRPFRDVREPTPISRYVVPHGAHARSSTNESRSKDATPCHIDPVMRLRMPQAMVRRLCNRETQAERVGR